MSEFVTTASGRESWLAQATDLLRPRFAAIDLPLPDKIRVTCGWPSRGGTGQHRRVVGQCWKDEASTDGTWEVSVSPTLDERQQVLATLIHELLHTACFEAGHSGEFKRGHALMGLDGKPTTSEPGMDFLERYSDVFQIVGDYPHARIDPAKKPGSISASKRPIKLLCDQCDYTVHVADRFVDRGLPTCCCGGTLLPVRTSESEAA